MQLLLQHRAAPVWPRGSNSAPPCWEATALPHPNKKCQLQTYFSQPDFLRLIKSVDGCGLNQTSWTGSLCVHLFVLQALSQSVQSGWVHTHLQISAPLWLTPTICLLDGESAPAPQQIRLIMSKVSGMVQSACFKCPVCLLTLKSARNNLAVDSLRKMFSECPSQTLDVHCSSLPATSNVTVFVSERLKEQIPNWNPCFLLLSS